MFTPKHGKKCPPARNSKEAVAFLSKLKNKRKKGAAKKMKRDDEGDHEYR